MNGLPKQTTYRIDKDGMLTWVDLPWRHFARQNGAPELAVDSVLGQSLWDSVDGIETRHVYELMFKNVRRERCSIVLPFRCDSPDTRRFMTLKISPCSGPHEDIEFAAALLRTEPREPVPLLSQGERCSCSMLSVCSFCKRFEVPGSGWLEVEQAASRLGLLSTSRLPKLSHGVCPDCANRARALLMPRHRARVSSPRPCPHSSQR